MTTTEVNLFLKLIKKYRFQQNLSREELAKELNICYVTLHRWENQITKPAPRIIKNIQDYINLRLTFLDPYEVVLEEIVNLQKKIEDLTQYLKKHKK